MTTHAVLKAPQAVNPFTHADRVVDISDAWREQTDPNNERGEVCLAYFASEKVPCQNERHECFTGDGLALIGISVRDNSGTVYRGREWAVKMLGTDTVWQIELYEMEAV